MNLVRWTKQRNNPGQSGADFPLARIRNEVDSLFDRFFRPWSWSNMGLDAPWTGSDFTPQAELAETDSQVTITMELPGIDPKNLDLSLTGDLLTVRGEKRCDREENRAGYHYSECSYGSFQRTFQLPSTVDPDKVAAAYQNGVLTITLDKHPDAKPKQIKVKTL